MFYNHQMFGLHFRYTNIFVGRLRNLPKADWYSAAELWTVLIPNCGAQRDAQRKPS